MDKIKLKWPKFYAFLDKTHLHYLALAFLLYGFKAALYFLIAFIPTTRIATFNMEIDAMIPMVKYFYVFYLGYYFVPEIFIWILSFYDKRKVFNLIIGGAVANIICCICFLIYQVKMIRPDYYMDYVNSGTWPTVNSISTLFDWGIVFQYNADSTALNCFPSIHATFGTMMALIGVPMSKDELQMEKKLPLWIRVFCIIFGLGIVMSTFFVKQHYFIDALVGLLLMVACYFLARYLIDLYLKKKEKKLEVKEEQTAQN